MSRDENSAPKADEKHQNPEGDEDRLEIRSSHTADLDRENTYENLQIDRLEEQVRSENTRRALLRRRLFETEQRLADQGAELQRVCNEFQRITNTTAWKLIERYWRLNMRLLPSGTRRRALYDGTRQIASRILGLGGRSAAQPSRAELPARLDDKDEEFTIHCDTPRPGEYCTGTLIVRGRVIAGAALQSVEILLDDRQIATDSAAECRGNLVLEPRGFFLRWDTNSAKEGSHILKITAAANSGVSRTVSIPITIDQTAEHRTYQLWIAMNEHSIQDLVELKENVKFLVYQPTFGILLRLRFSTATNLRITMESIVKQIYENWELRILTEGSIDPNLQRLIAEYAQRDPRIKFQEAPPATASKKTSDETIFLPPGDFLGFVDEGDELAPEALYEVARTLGDFPKADLIYSDEDDVDLLGRRSAPFFKPDWSRDLFLSMNYVSRFLILRRELVQGIGGVPSEYGEDQRYGLALRAVEKTDRIRHIPTILYHRRHSHHPISSNQRSSRNALQARNALAAYLERNNVPATVEDGLQPGSWRVHYEILDNPKVSLVIAAGPRVDLLRNCLDSILKKTAYPNFEIVLADNSKGTDVQHLLDSLRAIDSRIIYLDYRNRPFNFSAINNSALRETTAPLVVFLNDDTEAVSDEWLSALVEHGQRPQVGVVGAKLLYPFGLIQHAGVALGIYGSTAHPFRHFPAPSAHHFGFAQVIRNCSAVTAACMMTKRDLFLKLGGFNEQELTEAFQDVDYCLRTRETGLLVVYTPYATLVHHESASRGFAVNPTELHHFGTKWAEAIACDPYYSPNLTREAEDYSIRVERKCE
jgi:GT2 family glycosyltransferase